MPNLIVNLQPNVVPGAWQNNPNIQITWDPATDDIGTIKDYFWFVDDLPGNNSPDTGVWTNTFGTSASFDLSSNPPYGEGSWWFHVAARNEFDTVGPVTHLNVRYRAIGSGSPPSIPGDSFMNANGDDTLINTPLVPHGTPTDFTWSDSTPVIGDVTYVVEVAYQPNFDFDSGLGRSSIVATFENLTTPEVNLDPMPQPGTYYWRILASDDESSSDWSSVGSFLVNAPPGAPSQLSVALQP